MRAVQVLSSHRLAARSGDCAGVAAAGAAAGFVFAQRWGNTAGVFQRLRQAQIGMAVTTGFTAAQLVGYDFAIGRSYTVSSTGGTAITLTGNNTKLLQNADTTRLTDARIALAVALGAGTVTPDAALIGIDSVWSLAGIAGAGLNHSYDFSDADGGGLFLEQDEGIILRNLVALGAAGTVQFYVELEWDEVLIS